MRPIDADELKKAIGRYVVDDAKLSFNKLYENEDLLKVYQLVTAMPTIDAVPVTHCKDCKFWRTYAYVNGRPKFLPKCGYNQIYVNGEDFCSRAERRENDKR